MATVSHENICRLDVPMNETLCVRGIQRIGDLYAK